MKTPRRFPPGRDDDFTPMYYQLEKELLRDIEDGRWAPGEPIPSAGKIATARGLSLGTVQKAVLNLVNAGYLYRIQGKGTFVSGTMLRRDSLRYYRLRPDFQAKEAGLKIRMLSLEVVEGRQPVNRRLKIRGANKLYLLKRVFFNRNVPLVYSVSFLPRKMFRELDRLPVDRLEKITFYEMLEQVYRLPTVFNQELYDIALADEETAGILKIEAGRPVLSVEMLSFTYKEQPYEYRISRCLTGAAKLYREI